MHRWGGAVLLVLVVAAGCSDDDAASSDESVADSSSTTTTSIEQAATTSVAVETTTTTVAPRGDAVAVPTVVAVTGGDRNGLPANPAPRELLDEYDYVEEEFFISGDAARYAPVGELGEDGMWTVEPAGATPFTTRILVRRPADPAEANGVVGVEWLNVSGGQDADPDFGFLYPEILASGTSWVGVSAQFGGVDGPGLGIDIPGVDPIPLKTADPTRYEPIEHPGDDYSYDIYSQAAQAIRQPDGIDPLGGVPADHVIALGESQSAGRLTAYINAVHPIADIYDGFLVHSRGGGAAPIDSATSQSEIVRYRTDLTDPILWFQTETD
ncbi:MAG: alpha/beta hydrolase domain-containing protein, partial [Acidimicrobiia bacterium]|nr:alpha/beta hydrolase domain-containing protein [Acidimicrobiia bacterium]